MLASPLLKLIGSFFTFLLVGLIFGNVIFLYVALIPLFIGVVSLAFGAPAVNIQRSTEHTSAWVNDDVELATTVTAHRGIGIITIAEALPAHFDLVEGSNFRVYWKSFRKLSTDFRYSIRCTKRGVYHITPLKYETRHFSGFKQTVIHKDEGEIELVVRPKPLNVRRMRNPKLISRIPMPLTSLSKLGMMTTDFKEIREYTIGDSYRHINWKATARLMSRSASQNPWPLMNEFEREGKKVVWLFLDGSSLMGIGTSVESAFEYAVQAVSGLAEFYLARNCNVGLYVYNNGGHRVLPDSGRKQEYKISRELLGIDISTTSEPLKDAIEKCRGHLLGTTPLFIVITTVRKQNTQELLDGIKMMRKYINWRSRQPQIIVLHVTGYAVAARGGYEELGATMLEMRNQPLIQALRRGHAFVIPWNPKRQSLSSTIMAGVRHR